MEAGTAPSRTGSQTMADLLVRAAALYADRTLGLVKRDGTWQEHSYAQAGAASREIALGLLALGVAAGDRVCILANTRLEWTLADFAISSAGAVVVPIYHSNSPDECAHVVADSDAVAIFCENAEQAAKIEAVRGELPTLRHVIVFDPDGGLGGSESDTISLDDLRAMAAQADPAQLDARTAAVTPADPFTFIYTSGTTGPPKGCVLTHGNYRSMVDSSLGVGMLTDVDSEDEVVYLFLPLAHSYALLMQLIAVDAGATIAYFGGDLTQVIAEVSEVRPTYLPSVPRVFEKLFALAQAMLPAEEIELMSTVGGRIHDLEAAGEPVPDDLRERFEPVAAKAEFIRNLFGGRLREAITGAAPIGKEILEFFWGAGVAVMEGYGLTETSTAASVCTREAHRFGTVGRPLPGVEVRIADDGEVLIRGGNVFAGYHKHSGDTDTTFGVVVDGWLHTGDLGAVDEDGYLTISGRKKDLIITAGGKNLSPANFENDLKQSRWVSQCVMYGDRRPYPVALVTLDAETVVPWATEQGIEDVAPAALATDDRVCALIQAEIDQVNARYAQVEQVKRFLILDHDLTQETGELTPTMKVKRNVIYERYSAAFDELYGG